MDFFSVDVGLEFYLKFITTLLRYFFIYCQIIQKLKINVDKTNKNIRMLKKQFIGLEVFGPNLALSLKLFLIIMKLKTKSMVNK